MNRGIDTLKTFAAMKHPTGTAQQAVFAKAFSLALQSLLTKDPTFCGGNNSRSEPAAREKGVENAQTAHVPLNPVCITLLTLTAQPCLL